MRPPPAAPAVALQLLLLASCGARSTPQLPAVARRDAAPTRADAGTSRDRSTAARVEGVIQLVELVDGPSGAEQGTALARFTPAPHPFFSPLQRIDDRCSLHAKLTDGPGEVAVGPIEVSGGPYDFVLLPRTPDPSDAARYPPTLFPRLFNDGRIVRVEAPGDGRVAGFSGGVAGVGQLDVRFPEGPLPRGAPLELGFEPGDRADPIWIVVVPDRQGDDGPQLRCIAAPGSTGFTVPSQAMASLPKSSSIVVAAGWANEVVLEPSSTLEVHLLAARLTLQPLRLR